jgi:hypothetical protein
MLAQPDVIGVFHMPLLGGSVLGHRIGITSPALRLMLPWPSLLR